MIKPSNKPRDRCAGLWICCSGLILPGWLASQWYQVVWRMSGSSRSSTFDFFGDTSNSRRRVEKHDWFVPPLSIVRTDDSSGPSTNTPSNTCGLKCFSYFSFCSTSFAPRPVIRSFAAVVGPPLPRQHTITTSPILNRPTSPSFHKLHWEQRESRSEIPLPSATTSWRSKELRTLLFVITHTQHLSPFTPPTAGNQSIARNVGHT